MKKSNLFFLLLILIGFFLRFYQLEYFAGFDFDQVTAVRIAQKALAGRPSLIGQEVSVGGIFVGPFYNWITAILLFFSRGEPLIIYYFQAFLGIISIILIYKTSQNLMAGSGKWSALLYVFSFRMIYWDKTAAPSNWLVFLTILASFFYSLKTTPTKKFILVSLVFGFASQLHPAGVSLVVFPLGLFFKNRNQISFKKLLLGLVTFLIWFSPLILFDLRHDFLNTRGLLKTILSEKEAYPLIFRFIKSLGLYIDVIITLFSPQRFLLIIFGLILILISNLELFLKNKLILSLCFSSLIIFSFYKGSVFDYYFIPSICGVLILISLYLENLTKKFTLIPSTFFILILIISNLIYLNSYKIPYSLGAKKDVVEYVQKSVDQSETEIVIHLDTDLGQSNGFDYLFEQTNLNAIFDYNNPDFVIYIPESRSTKGDLIGDIRVQKSN